MPKFFISREDIQGSYIVIRHDVHHIVHVLRKQTGDTLTARYFIFGGTALVFAAIILLAYLRGRKRD